MKNAFAFVAMFTVGLLLSLSSCQGAACKGFCDLECKHTVTCADGNAPTGATFDACVNSCVDSVRMQGAKTDEDCECCTGGHPLPDGGVSTCPAGSKVCNDAPLAIWRAGYSC